ncbi:MAG: retropepsin-like aspartic protease [Hydrogenophaga sp.]|uniref:retropepsin-like aspartic protease family protein n=1 Tax=Hydrogenophaga sp. TaxID=1904254 RepID=UPI0027519F74|nr:retropepsin-like aspartic protease [Hydrogenophaga sp.]MDP2416498.1 retropepsin-like aspartic protease [Hydrogenophaga sp.]MDZ4187207.1 retropepsin-like aspartic protease [Hydrogenophaga sp.]
MLTHLLHALVLALAAGASLAQSVALSGVAGSRALLTVDGTAPKFVSTGQTHQGAKLLSVQGETAVVEVDGQRQTLRVGDAPVSVGKPVGEAGAQRIVLTADSQGHFMPPGQINGRAVRFMVDTGATLVILSESDAKRINLKYEQGQKVRVNTANGGAVGYQVKLDSVKVGDAQVYAVPAIVLPQAMPYVLLGNSFLTRFQMQRQNDQLTLERRF